MLCANLKIAILAPNKPIRSICYK